VDAAVGVDGGPGPGIDGGALPDSGPGPGIDAGAVPDSGAGPGVDAGTVDAGEGRDHASDGGCCSVAPGAGRDDSRALAVGGLLLACLLPRRRRRA